MTTRLRVGDQFPDAELPDHDGLLVRLSSLTVPSDLDRRLAFDDGYPLIVVFYRGFYCPRDQEQMRHLVRFQDELKVNYCQIVSISVQLPEVQAAFRAGLGARWSFLADENRSLIKSLGILDRTEGEYAFPAQPYTFVLRPDLTVHRMYNGWWYVGRPTLEELRQDLRAIMETLSNYHYEAFDTAEARQVRIPQQEWTDGAPPLGKSGLPVVAGVVTDFDLLRGNGTIACEDEGSEVFFSFTAIPGSGYRTIRPGTAVRFELVETRFGLTARNVQTAG
jgi:peroxiredoxin/cold shock CspA family protein